MHGVIFLKNNNAMEWNKSNENNGFLLKKI